MKCNENNDAVVARHCAQTRNIVIDENLYFLFDQFIIINNFRATNEVFSSQRKNRKMSRKKERKCTSND